MAWKHWRDMTIRFKRDAIDSDIFHAEVTHGISETQLKQFSNLVLGCTYKLWPSGRYSAFTRFSTGSRVARKLTTIFNIRF